jgi:trehalose 6-phosphate synthase/phosphatase
LFLLQHACTWAHARFVLIVDELCPAWLCRLQEVSQQLLSEFNCHPVFLGADLKTNYYKREHCLGSVASHDTRKPDTCRCSSRPPAGKLGAMHERTTSSASPVFCPLLPAGFCKQQLWPILHYLIPLSPYSLGRFDPSLWSAYVRANMAFANKLVEVRAALAARTSVPSFARQAVPA